MQDNYARSHNNSKKICNYYFLLNIYTKDLIKEQMLTKRVVVIQIIFDIYLEVTESLNNTYLVSCNVSLLVNKLNII